MEERGKAIPLTERERAARHFGVDASQVTPKMIQQLPERGTGLETGRARGAEEVKMPTQTRVPEKEKLTEEDIHVSICTRWDELDFAINEAETEPCSQTLYAQLVGSDTIDIIRELCQDIKKELGLSDILCYHVALDMELSRNHAAEALTKRCSPLPLIAKVKARGVPSEEDKEEIKEIEHVCKLAGDQGCLNIIKQVMAGVKQ